MVAGAIALGAPAQARHLYVGTVESPTVVQERVHVVRPSRLHVITPSWRMRERRVSIGEPAFVERTRMSGVHILRDSDRDLPRYRMRESRMRMDEPRMIVRTRESRVRIEPRPTFVHTTRVDRNTIDRDRNDRD